MPGKDFIDPVEIEGLLSRRARAGLREKWMSEQRAEQVFVDIPGACPATARVVPFAEVLFRPLVEQSVARPAIEAADERIAVQQADVGNTTHIDDRSP